MKITLEDNSTVEIDVSWNSGNNRCTCNTNIIEHTCPYRCDVNNDDKTLCKCCPYCMQSCVDDV